MTKKIKELPKPLREETVGGGGTHTYSEDTGEAPEERGIFQGSRDFDPPSVQSKFRPRGEVVEDEPSGKSSKK